MQKLLETIKGYRKFDTDSATLILVWKNRWLQMYEQAIGASLPLPEGKMTIEKTPMPPMLDVPPFVMDAPEDKPTPPSLETDEPDMDDDGNPVPKDEPEEEQKPELPVEDEVDTPKLSPFWQAELLFRKDNGKYFIYGVGGGASDYWNQKDGEFIPLDSEVEAIEWAVNRLGVEDVEEVFGKFYE